MTAKGTTTKAATAKKDAAVHNEATAQADEKNQIKGDVVAAAHKAVSQAEARKANQDAKAEELTQEQQDKAAANLAADEEAKARAGETVIALPDPNPSVPLTKEEQDALGTARQVIAQVDNPNMPPLTEEALQRIEDAKDQPPASINVPIPTPGASATNLALMRNDVDPTKTPPFGVGNRADLQG